ncbi:MAG: MBL fold metallo-hydrolase [Dehalococcoidia bacterium]|nr:MBL fold metallo-hydrolase [Dehalococcoidia bacterium]
MDITWLGHAAFRLMGTSQTVYIDPVEMEYCGARTKRLFDNPEPADIILLTHHHTDHCNPESFQRMRTPSTVIIGPRACCDKVRGLVQEIHAGDTVTIGGAIIRAVQAYNIKRQRAPGVPFHPRDTGVGYVVELDNVTVYHSGDTEPIPEMEGVGPADVALLPVDGHYTMSPEEALEAAVRVKARIVIPMHFFDTPVGGVLTGASAVQNSTIRVLEVGETLSMSE